MLPVQELVLSGEDASIYVSGGLIKEPTNLKIMIYNPNNEFNIEFLPAGSHLEFATLKGDSFVVNSIDLGVDISYKANKFSIRANHSNVDVYGDVNDSFKLTMYDMGPKSRIDIHRKSKERA